MSDSSEDELDKLTRTFEEQASNDLRCLTQRQQSAKANRRRPKGMKEIREEGLQAPVPEDSKGFKMLAQMGYQKGAGLGKNSNGRAEPVDLLVKDKRTGLGMDEERKRRREESEKWQALRDLKRQQIGHMMQKDFAQQQAMRLADRRYDGQLKSARKVIETLDRRKGLEQNFLWPLPEQTDEEAAEGEDHEVKVDDIQESQEASWEDQPVKDKLISALRYLRAHYFYCLHCGHQYENAKELDSQCPGTMDEDH